jgi:hypothetical protein
VSYSRGQCPKGTQFFCLEQLVLPLLQLGNHPVEPLDHTLCLIARIVNLDRREIPSGNPVRSFFDIAKRTNDFSRNDRNQQTTTYYRNAQRDQKLCLK